MKSRITAPILLSIWFFLIQLVSHAQLTVTPGSTLSMTPIEFVQTYLAGTGITILPGATFNGSTAPLNSPLRMASTLDQIGAFAAAGGAVTQLGITGGVILTSGKVQNAIAGGNSTVATGSGSDPDLAILAGTASVDKAVLEFDFIPETNFVNFRYVFTSFEFDGFCVSTFNDPFGLFISGPGINGGLGFVNNAINIAQLPDGSSYVNIHNICQADNGNHGSGKYSWWNPTPHDYYAYNRLTYVYTASYPVECGLTYHMKFATSDADDASMDSGVFLEQNSFASTTPVPAPEFSNPQTGDLLIPGCSTIDLFYTIPTPRPVGDNTTVYVTIHPTGTATQADILPDPFPGFVIIPGGQVQSNVIHIEARPGAPQPDKTLVIKATVNNCNVMTTVMNTFTVKYNTPLSVTAPPVTECSGNPATLTASATGGQTIVATNSYHFLWSNGSTQPAISVSQGPGHHTYTVTVTDACNQSVIVPTYADVGTTPVAAGAITGNATICTPDNGISYVVQPISGASNYVWTLPAGASIIAGSNTGSITVDFTTSAVSGNITVKGNDNYCGDGAPSVLSLAIHPAPEPAGAIYGPAGVCQGPSPIIYSIDPVAFATSYAWSVPAGVDIIPPVDSRQIACIFTAAAVSGTITVRGYNSDCLYGNSASMPVVINPLPGNAGAITSLIGQEVCQNQQGVTYTIPPVQFATDYVWNYTGTGASPTSNGTSLILDFSSSATSGILTVKAMNACGEGTLSPAYPVLVKPKPTVVFTICNASQTTKNGRPILLKGGKPLGTGGVYSGTGVLQVSAGVYVFDPTDASVLGGSTAGGIDYPVTFRYTNLQGCFDDQTTTITVYASNAGDPCPGILIDHRSNKDYPTIQTGTGATAKCWMAENLLYGDYKDDALVQTDNCSVEYYCPDNLQARCSSAGGAYQWAELMEYQNTGTYQDICPGGWHVPTSAEWDQLITAFQGSGIAGSNLKDNQVASGFHAILDGVYYLDNTWAFTSGSSNAGTMFWTSTGLPGGCAVARGLNALTPSVSWYPSSRASAFPVRCIRN